MYFEKLKWLKEWIDEACDLMTAMFVNYSEPSGGLVSNGNDFMVCTVYAIYSDLTKTLISIFRSTTPSLTMTSKKPTSRPIYSMTLSTTLVVSQEVPAQVLTRPWMSWLST